MTDGLTASIKKGELKLAETDPVMARLIAEFGPVKFEPRSDYFHSLTSSIISQQVSVAAARSIFKRFSDGTDLDPMKIDDMDVDELKEFGLSRQKAGYLKDLASHFVNDSTVYNHLSDLDDETVIEDLTVVKGIGPWTAQMFLMFTLVRLDVFAPDDLGLQRAIDMHYPKERLDNPKMYSVFAKRWAPYRTIAAWYLWKSVDTTPMNNR